MKRAALYCRVSSSGQAETGTSLETQLDSCRQYAAAQGYTVLYEAQEDVSGTTLARAGLDAIRDMARDGQLDAVICYDPDRLTRDLGHLMLLLDELEGVGAPLVFVNAPHDRTPEGLMLLQVRGMVAQYERTKIIERMRRGKERATRNGRIIQWMVPYGYTRNADAQTLEVVEDEAQTVRLIFEWMASGTHTLYSIAMRLRGMGIPNKRGGKWWVSTVHRILLNETYTGTYWWNMTRKRGKRQVKRPRAEWLSVDVPPLITRDLFERAGANIWHNRTFSQRNKKYDYLLSGMLLCARCGAHYRAVRDVKPSGKSYAYYYCPRQGNAYEQARVTCGNVRLRLEDVEREVWQAVTDYLIHGAPLLPNARVRASECHKDRAQASTRLQASQRALEALEREEGRILEAYRQGAIEVAQLRRELEAIAARREAATRGQDEARKVLAFPARDTRPRGLPSDLRRAIEANRDAMSFEERRRVLVDLQTRVLVDGPTLDIRTLPNDDEILVETGAVSGKLVG